MDILIAKCETVDVAVLIIYRKRIHFIVLFIAMV